MIFWPIVAAAILVSLLTLAVAGVRFGVPALNHRRHERTLANIARLEIELGIGQATQPLPQVTIDRAWRERASAPPYREAQLTSGPPIIGHCSNCNRDVMLNRGACTIEYGQVGQCAKEQWYRNRLGLDHR